VNRPVTWECGGHLEPTERSEPGYNNAGSFIKSLELLSHAYLDDALLYYRSPAVQSVHSHLKLTAATVDAEFAIELKAAPKCSVLLFC